MPEKKVYPEVIEKAKEMYDHGDVLGVIAAELGISVNTLQRIIRGGFTYDGYQAVQNGYYSTQNNSRKPIFNRKQSTTKVTPDLIDIIKKMHDAGVAPKVIYDNLPISGNTYYKVEKAGFNFDNYKAMLKELASKRRNERRAQAKKNCLPEYDVDTHEVQPTTPDPEDNTLLDELKRTNKHLNNIHTALLALANTYVSKASTYDTKEEQAEGKKPFWHKNF